VPDRQIIPGRYVVVFKYDSYRSASEVDRAVEALEATHGFQAGVRYYAALKGFAAELSNDVVEALRGEPGVKYIDNVYRGYTTAQVLPIGPRRVGVKLNGPARVDQVNDGHLGGMEVAVLDTGIDVDHPELTVPGGVRFVGPTPTCSDGSSSFDDDNGHGTLVSGTIAAKDNTSQVAGVAPGARTWAVKIFGSGGGGESDCAIKGVDWVTDKKLRYTAGYADGINFRVANMSFRFFEDIPWLCDAVNTSVLADIVYVAAAGNENRNNPSYSPANCSHVITVSAIADYNGLPGGGASPTCSNYGTDDTLASFSNYGSMIEIAAPGTCTETTARGGGTALFSGTSAAAPHVSGGVVLFIWSGHTGSKYGPTVVGEMQNRGWAIAQNSACGFSGDRDNFAEPLLWLAPGCGSYSRIFSDVNCSGTINSTDANDVLRHVSYLPVTQTEPCPDIGPSIKTGGTFRRWGDVDCDGDIDSVDANKIQQYVDGGSPSQNPGCPAFGSTVMIDVTGSL
jgi:subtilisin family serine protease